MTQKKWTPMTGDEDGNTLVRELNSRLGAEDTGQESNLPANILLRNAPYTVEGNGIRELYISNGDGTGVPAVPDSVLKRVPDAETARDVLELGQLATLDDLVFSRMGPVMATDAEALAGEAENKLPTVAQVRDMIGGGAPRLTMIGLSSYVVTGTHVNGTDEWWFLSGLIRVNSPGGEIQVRESSTSGWVSASISVTGGSLLNYTVPVHAWMPPGGWIRLVGASYTSGSTARWRFLV